MSSPALPHLPLMFEALFAVQGRFDVGHSMNPAASSGEQEDGSWLALEGPT
jgi:hypothetical protein